MGVVRSEAFMILFPAARLGLAISLAGAAVGAGFFFYGTRKNINRASGEYIGCAAVLLCPI